MEAFTASLAVADVKADATQRPAGQPSNSHATRGYPR